MKVCGGGGVGVMTVEICHYVHVMKQFFAIL